MKAKITKPDGTIIELEGEPLELAIFLPDLKGFQLPTLPEPVTIPSIWTEVRCTCNDAWFGIVPPPPCPLHPTYKITYTTGTKADPDLEFNP